MNDIIRTKRLRAMIGWLGMLLPWIVTLLVGMFPPSISATWYTNACTPFMIILGSAGMLLMCYHGYDKVDDILNTFAGIFALFICLFPCSLINKYGVNNFKNLSDIICKYSSINNESVRIGTFLIPMYISDIIHSISAVGFFAILSYNSFFQFTKSSGELTRNKKIRNIIYRICGIGMMSSFLLFLLPYFYIKVWLIEVIALFFFGVSWLTKANRYKWLFCD